MDYPVKDSRFFPADAVALQFVDTHTVISVYKQAGRIIGQERWVVSTDGKQMNATIDGTQRNGGRMQADFVFEKQ